MQSSDINNGMKGPQSWKDILKNKPAVPSEESGGHRWSPIGSKGGKKFYVRRLEAGYASAKVNREPRVIFYKCEKCGIEASKTVGQGSITPKDYQYHNLTCDEVIIKEIIV